MCRTAQGMAWEIHVGISPHKNETLRGESEQPCLYFGRHHMLCFRELKNHHAGKPTSDF